MHLPLAFVPGSEVSEPSMDVFSHISLCSICTYLCPLWKLQLEQCFWSSGDYISHFQHLNPWKKAAQPGEEETGTNIFCVMIKLKMRKSNNILTDAIAQNWFSFLFIFLPPVLSTGYCYSIVRRPDWLIKWSQCSIWISGLWEITSSPCKITFPTSVQEKANSKTGKIPIYHPVMFVPCKFLVYWIIDQSADNW